MHPRKPRAFTLVELIITIAIIVVLAVTAFLVITKWISKSRDSSRLSDIAVIQQGLETEIVNTKNYPMPDNYTGIYDTGNALARYQGEFTDNVKGAITTLNKTPKDPQGRNYGYSLSNDKKQYQIRAFLENTSYNFNYTDTASAATQISKINGNYNGFLVTATGTIYTLWNIPTLFVWSGTGISSGTNYVNENNKPIDNTGNIKFADVSGLYDANAGNNSSTLDSIVTTFSGSNGVSSQSLAQLTMKTAAGGVSIVSIISSSSISANIMGDDTAGRSWSDGSFAKSCNQYKNPSGGYIYDGSVGDGIYWIDTNGGDSSDKIKVYCDMTSQGGGWTRLVLNGPNMYNTVWTNTNGYNAVTDVVNISKAWFTLRDYTQIKFSDMGSSVVGGDISGCWSNLSFSEVISTKGTNYTCSLGVISGITLPTAFKINASQTVDSCVLTSLVANYLHIWDAGVSGRRYGIGINGTKTNGRFECLPTSCHIQNDPTCRSSFWNQQTNSYLYVR